MSDRDFLLFKEKNLIEHLSELEKSVEIGENNVEHLVQTNPDINRIAGAREALELAKEEFESCKQELSEVRAELAK